MTIHILAAAFGLVMPVSTQAPQVYEVWPDAGAPGSVVSILGEGFDAAGGTEVFFGGVGAPVLWAGSYFLLTEVPDATPGAVQVHVVAGGAASNAVPFQVLAPAGPPAVAGIEPPEAYPGAWVRISGGGFPSAWEWDTWVDVDFGGVASPYVLPVEPDELWAIVPGAPPGAAPVVVTVDGASSAPFPFTVLAAPDPDPVLAEVWPPGAPPGAVVQILGAGLLGWGNGAEPWGVAVLFGSVEGVTLWASPEEIWAVVPCDLPAGPTTISVTIVAESTTYTSNALPFVIEPAGTPAIDGVEALTCAGWGYTQICVWGGGFGSGFCDEGGVSVAANGIGGEVAARDENFLCLVFGMELAGGTVTVTAGGASASAAFTSECPEDPGDPSEPPDWPWDPEPPGDPTDPEPPDPDAPALSVAPWVVQFEATAGAGDPSPQTVLVANVGGGTLGWSAQGDAAWLSVSPGSGTLAAGGSAALSISVDATGLAPGAYEAEITITSAEALYAPDWVAIELVVEAEPPVVEDEPALGLDPPWLDFVGTAGGASAPPQVFLVRNDGGGVLSWEASADAPWIMLSPSTGNVGAGGSVAVTATVSATGLAPGYYEAEITVSAAGALWSPQVLPVSIDVVGQ